MHKRIQLSEGSVILWRNYSNAPDVTVDEEEELEEQIFELRTCWAAHNYLLFSRIMLTIHC